MEVKAGTTGQPSLGLSSRQHDGSIDSGNRENRVKQGEKAASADKEKSSVSQPVKKRRRKRKKSKGRFPCIKCGSLNCGPYTSAKMLPGGRIIIRHVQCLDCGQWRIDRLPIEDSRCDDVRTHFAR